MTHISMSVLAEEGEEEVWLHLQEERRGGRRRLAAVRARREGSPILPQNPGHNHQPSDPIDSLIQEHCMLLTPTMPFKEKLMSQWLQVLVGPPGVGRRALVQRIVAHNPKLFDTIKAGQYFINSPNSNPVLNRNPNVLEEGG